MAPHLLPPAAARTLYNAADALLPPEPGAVGFDWAPGAEAALRRRGPAAARWLRWRLRRLEWAPLWRGAGRSFSALPREARAACLAARPGDRRALATLLAEAAGPIPSAAAPAPAQSASGV